MNAWKFAPVAMIAFAVLLAGCAETIEHGDALKQKMAESYCKSSEPYKAEVMGYLEEKDDVLNLYYAFLVCKTTNLNTGELEMKIRSNILTGTSLTSAQALEFSEKAVGEGKAYVIRGSPFVPEGALDKRKIEYRLNQENGKPVSLEILLILRNSDRTAKPEKTLSIDWPAS